MDEISFVLDLPFALRTLRYLIGTWFKFPNNAQYSVMYWHSNIFKPVSLYHVDAFQMFSFLKSNSRISYEFQHFRRHFHNDCGLWTLNSWNIIDSDRFSNVPPNRRHSINATNFCNVVCSFVSFLSIIKMPPNFVCHSNTRRDVNLLAILSLILPIHIMMICSKALFQSAYMNTMQNLNHNCLSVWIIQYKCWSIQWCG